MQNAYPNQLIHLVNEYLTKTPRSNNIKSKYPNEYALLLEKTNFLHENASCSQRFWHIRKNMKLVPLCKYCGINQVKWHASKKGYVEYCSVTCASNDPCTRQKAKQTNLNRFGVTSYSKTDEFKQIFKTDEYLQSRNSKDAKSKLKQTNLERYGVEYSTQSIEVKEKIKQTNLERHGVENAGGTTESQIKAKKTIKKLYGVEHYNHTDEFKVLMKKIHNDDEMKKISVETHKKTMRREYGVDYTFQLDSVQVKIKESFNSRFGGRHPTQAHISERSMICLNDKEWLIDQHHLLQRTASDIAVELQVHVTTVLDYLGKNSIELKRFDFSTGEREILEFIRSLDITCIHGSREVISPYELDIYIPVYNIAIEYNGLYWHSEAAGKSEKYHLMKTEMCEERGIRLIHIFEDEWIEQQQKCKDTLIHFFGKSKKGDFARNVSIKEISCKVARDFLNQYHLLNAGTSGSYRIGAFNKMDELIGVMVFGQSNNEGGDAVIELKRFVTNKKNNPGLGSKMFKYAIIQKDYKSIIAFVDRRWFTGLVKGYIGFNKIAFTKPALWWTDGEHRYHRRFKTKSQLIKEGFDSNLTKRQMMRKLGYYRIWDSGKIKLRWDII